MVRFSFYAWLRAEESRQARERADVALAHEITVIHLASRGTYGVPRVHAELRRLGRAVNRKRVERIMRERGIAGVTRRRRRWLTRPDKRARPAPDLIGRDFTATRPGTKLVGDIAYLPTREGWLYLACWLDLATREVIGYAMAEHHRAELVIDALRMAHGQGGLQLGCIAHSDRGSEYTSTQFRQELPYSSISARVVPSMPGAPSLRRTAAHARRRTSLRRTLSPNAWNRRPGSALAAR